MRCVVFRLDRTCERFDRAEVQDSHFFGMAASILEAADIQAVRPLEQVQTRQNQNPRHPTETTRDQAVGPRDRRREQIWSEPASRAFAPYPQQRDALTEARIRRHGERVHHEAGPRSREHGKRQPRASTGEQAGIEHELRSTDGHGHVRDPKEHLPRRQA
jgi:hypothetical protein